MVRVVCKTRNEAYKEIFFYGHTGFAKFKPDIVCSAVSALFINAMNSIEMFTEDAPVTTIYRKGKSSQIIRATIPDEICDDTKLLLDSMFLGLKEIESQYGKKYITLEFEEV